MNIQKDVFKRGRGEVQEHSMIGLQELWHRIH